MAGYGVDTSATSDNGDISIFTRANICLTSKGTFGNFVSLEMDGCIIQLTQNNSGSLKNKWGKISIDLDQLAVDRHTTIYNIAHTEVYIALYYTQLYIQQMLSREK